MMYSRDMDICIDSVCMSGDMDVYNDSAHGDMDTCNDSHAYMQRLNMHAPVAMLCIQVSVWRLCISYLQKEAYISAKEP